MRRGRDCGGDECIYRVFEPISEKIPPRPHHVSSFAKAVAYELGPGRYIANHRTMGVAEEPPKDPKNFLKRGGGIISSQAPRPPHKHQCYRPGMPHPPKYVRPPPVDKKKKKNKKEAVPTEEAMMGIPCCEVAAPVEQKKPEQKKNDQKDDEDDDLMRREKYDFNFRVQNIKVVTKQMARLPKIRVADTRRGDTFALEGSGLFPKYIYNEKYGKVPKYIVQRAEDMAKQAMLDQQGNRQPKCRYITQHERLELLEGLKTNWQQVTAAYNKQSVLIDNASKVARKARLENELKRLEKDILMLEGHPYIYVHDD